MVNCSRVIPLVASFSLLALAACSSGGGGSPATSNNSGANTSGNGASTTGGTSSTTTITAPGAATFGGNSPNVAAGSTPNFTSASPPPTGTNLTFNQSAVKLTLLTATDASVGGGTLTLQSQSPINGPSVILTGELKIPGISLDVPIFATGLNGGTSGGQPNGGGTLNADFGALTYTLLGRWDYQPPNSGGTTFFGYSLGGYVTPSAGVPAAGTATYSGTASPTSLGGGASPTVNTAGGAVGEIFFPMPSGVVTFIRVAGTANVNVNFATGAVTGSLTNMQFLGGATLSAWNDVSLTGSLSGASLSGTTSTSGPPPSAGNAGFSSSSTGKFNGALYGPNAQEVGAIWSLYDPSGKAALGGFVAK
jgi:hypothetical protein